jgi:cytidyltransferase-like protein
MKRNPCVGTRVIVPGCFDLFHDGHRHIIHTALFLCQDGQISIPINSDSSVEEIKGKYRPVDPYSARLENIQNCVRNWVRKNRVYPYLTVQEIQNEQRPDVREIVGSERWPVLIVPRLDGLSTTEQIEEINAQEVDPGDEEADQ